MDIKKVELHLHLDGSLPGLQSSIEASIQVVDNSISGLQDALSGSVTELHEHLNNLVIAPDDNSLTLFESLNGADGSLADGTPVTVGSNGAFSTTVTLSAGSNTITIVAKDSAGKTTTITRTVKYDPNPPKITAASVTPNPVDAGKTYVISVTVTDE